MHELSIVESIIFNLTEYCNNNNLSKVKKITLEIGALTNIEQSSLIYCFEIVAIDTIFANSEIEIIIEAGIAECQNCKTIFNIYKYFSYCPNCNSNSLKIKDGKKMLIKNIEI